MAMRIRVKTHLGCTNSLNFLSQHRGTLRLQSTSPLALSLLTYLNRPLITSTPTTSNHIICTSRFRLRVCTTSTLQYRLQHLAASPQSGLFLTHIFIPSAIRSIHITHSLGWRLTRTTLSPKERVGRTMGELPSLGTTTSRRPRIRTLCRPLMVYRAGTQLESMSLEIPARSPQARGLLLCMLANPRRSTRPLPLSERLRVHPSRTRIPPSRTRIPTRRFNQATSLKRRFFLPSLQPT